MNDFCAVCEHRLLKLINHGMCRICPIPELIERGNNNDILDAYLPGIDPMVMASHEEIIVWIAMIFEGYDGISGRKQISVNSESFLIDGGQSIRERRGIYAASL